MFGIEPGDSGLVIRYQADKFIHTILAEHFMAQSHIYLRFMCKLSTLTHFPLKVGCEDYFFLDQAVPDFKHGLCSILTDSVSVPEVVASIDKPHVILSLSSLVVVCSVSTISYKPKLQLAPSIKYKLWYKVRVLLLPVPVAGKM